MTDDYKEKEIAYFTTGLAVSDEFFERKQAMTERDLMPAFSDLLYQCSGLITEPGIYSVSIKVMKIT
jgi:hypothetical protein